MKYSRIIMFMLLISIAFSLTAQDVTFYEKYAQKGDKEAMYHLAKCYFDGTGVEQDFSQASYWLTKAAKKNYAPAQAELAYCYLYGIGVLKDYKQAWGLAQKAIKQKEPEAYYLIALMYKDGLFVKQNTTEFLQYMNCSASLGYAVAQYEMAKLLLLGDDKLAIERNIKQGIKLLEKAANQNNAEALLYIGKLYNRGLEGYVSKDQEKGFKYIQAAANMGHPRALYEYGYAKLYGYGCDKDVSEAYSYISAAAENEIPDAFKVMGDLYRYGYVYGIAQDYEAAAQWYQKAVNARYGEAYPSLASLYMDGKGVAKNIERAYQLFRLAADAGVVGGYVGLGNCYEYGIVVEKSISSAIQYYQKAANGGDKSSRVHLYNIYIEGDGVRKDVGKAIQYLRDAADDGYVYAMYLLGYEYYYGKHIRKDNCQAVNWMAKAANAGAFYAAEELGISYYLGLEPCQKDYGLAFKYLLLAVQQAYLSGELEDVKGSTFRYLSNCYRFGRGTEVDDSLASYYTELAAKYGDDASKEAVKLIRRNGDTQ